jgi:hypothetical protein
MTNESPYTVIDAPFLQHPMHLTDSVINEFFGRYLAKHIFILSNNIMTCHEHFDEQHLADCFLMYFDDSFTIEEYGLTQQKLSDKFRFYLVQSKDIVGYSY